ncbi:hypothetical protein Tco_0247499 [Tanacetum coccineum]
MIAFETRVRQDTNEVYTRLDDEQSQRQLLAGRLNMLFRDRRAHARTARLMETEVRMSREAWGRSMDASDLARTEVMSLRTTVLAQMLEIRELQDADRDSTTGIGDHLTGACDSITWTGHSTTGTGYCATGIAGTCWRPCIARAARGGW